MTAKLKKQTPKTTVDSFEFFKSVGQGSFGSVYLAKNKESGDFVAVKQLLKTDIIKMNKSEAVMREKNILNKLKHLDFIIDLKQTFMDENHLYFVFEHCKYGTLT